MSRGSLNFQIIICNLKYFYKKHFFCFKKYISSRNKIKLLHGFKGQLKFMIFPKRVRIDGLMSLPDISSSSSMSKTSPDELNKNCSR